MNISIEAVEFGTNDKGFHYHNHTELLYRKVSFEEVEAIKKSLAKIDEEHGLVDCYDTEHDEYEMGIVGLQEFLKDVNIPKLNSVLDYPDYSKHYLVQIYND